MSKKQTRIKLSIIPAFFMLAFFYAPEAQAEDHYVTQNGAGLKNGTSTANAFSVADFNNSAKWNAAVNVDDNLIGPGDTVYFSGTIVTQLEIPTGKGGASGNYVRIDGYREGECRPVSLGGLDPNAAMIQPNSGYGIKMDNNKFLVIEDISIINPNSSAIFSISSNSADILENIIFRRLGIQNATNGIHLTTSNVANAGVRYGTIESCLIKDINLGLAGSARAHIRIAAAHDLIIRKNYLYNDPAVPTVREGQDGIVLLSSRRVLIENNRMRRFGENCIDFKDDAFVSFGGVIIRYNHCSDTKEAGIIVQDLYGEHAYIHGNRVEATANNSGIGIQVYRGFEYAAIWANEIIDAGSSGILTLYDPWIVDGVIKDYRHVDDIVIDNNTIVGNRNISTDNTRGGVQIASSDGGDIFIRNNIYADNCINTSVFHQLSVGKSYASDVTSERNLYFTSTSAPKNLWAGISYTLLNPMSSSLLCLNARQDCNSLVADPKFSDLEKRILTLQVNSPAIDAGNKLVNPAWWNVPMIQGVSYNQEVALNMAMHPLNTDWDSTLPEVGMINQDNYGPGWEMGAYAYIGQVPSFIPGDLNKDGKVDIADYSMFIQDFGKTGANLAADLNKNGQVEIGDYSIFISNFGKTS